MNLTTRPAFMQRVTFCGLEGAVTWVSATGFATVRSDEGVQIRTPWPMLRSVQTEESVVR